MKKLVKLALSALFLVGTSAAYGFVDGFAPYVGIDATWQRTPFKHQFALNGNNNSHRGNHWGGSLFVGGRFCDMWGAELGFNQTGKKSSTRSGAFAGNQFFAAASNVTINTRTRFSTWYLDLNGYLPLDDCWQLIGSIGVGFVQPKLSINGTVTRNGVTTAFAGSNHNKTKGVFRLGVGAQYMATECFGIRGLVRWETTSSIKRNTTFAGTNNSYKPYRDSVIASLGVFWLF